MSRMKNILIVFVLVAVFGFLPRVATAQVIYDVVYARSCHQPNTETVISIQNTANIDCNVRVDWVNPAGLVIDRSDEVVLQPEETREFTTTLNVGAGVIQPYILDEPRNIGGDFEGGARVVCLTHDVTELGINATLVIDINPNTHFGRNYTSIKVIRPKGNRGD